MYISRDMTRKVCEIMGVPVEETIYRFSLGGDMDTGISSGSDWLEGQGMKQNGGIGYGTGMRCRGSAGVVGAVWASIGIS